MKDFRHDVSLREKRKTCGRSEIKSDHLLQSRVDCDLDGGVDNVMMKCVHHVERLVTCVGVIIVVSQVEFLKPDSGSGSCVLVDRWVEKMLMDEGEDKIVEEDGNENFQEDASVNERGGEKRVFRIDVNVVAVIIPRFADVIKTFLVVARRFLENIDDSKVQTNVGNDPKSPSRNAAVDDWRW